MKRNPLVAVTAALFGAAALAQTLMVTINGRPYSGSQPTVVVNGRTYVSLDVLKAAGVSVSTQAGRLNLTTTGTAGGQNQVGALNGCLNEMLFNGVWRLRIQSIETKPDPNKAGASLIVAKVETRNATPTNKTWHGTGFLDVGGSSFYLAFPDDTTIKGRVASLDDLYKQVIPGGALNTTITFSIPPEYAAQTPSKILWRLISPMNQPHIRALPWNNPEPNFRVDLTCRK